MAEVIIPIPFDCLKLSEVKIGERPLHKSDRAPSDGVPVYNIVGNFISIRRRPDVGSIIIVRYTPIPDTFNIPRVCVICAMAASNGGIYACRDHAPIVSPAEPAAPPEDAEPVRLYDPHAAAEQMRKEAGNAAAEQALDRSGDLPAQLDRLRTGLASVVNRLDALERAVEKRQDSDIVRQQLRPAKLTFE